MNQPWKLLVLAWACQGAWAAPVGVVPAREDTVHERAAVGDAVVEVAGARLRLNGSGYRTKGNVRINQIRVYASQRFASLEALVAMEGPKRISITSLAAVPSNFMGKALTRGIEDNTPKYQRAALVPSLIRLGEMFSRYSTLPVGSQVLIDWLPGQGTRITIHGEVQQEVFADPAFFHALASLWMGAVPVDPALKEALLDLQ